MPREECFLHCRLPVTAAWNPPFSAVLLDLDGCLLDSNGAHARAWSGALAAFGHRVPPARIRSQIGKGGSEILRDVVTPAERHFLGEAMGAEQTRRYLKLLPKVRPIRGAAAAVRAMRRAGVAVVLATSAERSVVERSLAKLGLARAITGFTSADDVRKAKPFEDVFAVSIERYGLPRRRTVAVGDTPFDVGAAHQLGLPCLALRSGGSDERLLASAERVFDDLGEAWRHRTELFGGLTA